MTSPSKEIDTKAVKVPVTLGSPQSDLDTTYRLAGSLAQSGLIPTTLRGKPSDVLAILLYGQELGIAPMQALQTIYVVNGRPTISAQLWVALARRAGHRVRTVDETTEACTVEITRSDDPDHPVRVTYTLAQAKGANLAGKDVWKQHPAAMLWARAVSTACRRACPEIAMGFGDEVDRHATEPQRPTLAQVAAERTDKNTNDVDYVENSSPGRLNAAKPQPEPAEDPERDAAIAAEVAELEAEHAAEPAGFSDDLFGGTP